MLPMTTPVAGGGSWPCYQSGQQLVKGVLLPVMYLPSGRGDAKAAENADVDRDDDMCRKDKEEKA